MQINFSFVNIGSITGVSSLLILLWQYIAKRYSFFQYMECMPDLLLLYALCKAEKEGYKFIRTGKDIVSLGHTQGNAWIKPYKCYPILFSRSAL